MIVELPELLWYGNKTFSIDLPDDWDVSVCPMRGANNKPLEPSEIKSAVENPIGTLPICRLAKNKKTAVIIFDDITRPTRTYEIAPFIIDELIRGGIDKEDISFVCALGTHGAHTNHEFRKKLGSEIVENYRVYNHNPYENCVDVGTTTRGTRLYVNRAVMEADLKIGIGCVMPHQGMGFSGGAKILFPGVSHIDSIEYNHRDVRAKAPESCGMGKYDDNILRLDIEEGARLAGLDFKVDVIVNAKGETAAVFAGDFQKAHKQAVEIARDVYATEPRPRDKNIVISNAFMKANEMGLSLLAGAFALESFTGTVVIIANTPEGQIPHYLRRSFGANYGGRLHPSATIPDSIKLILVSPHPDRTSTDWIANPEAFEVVKSWDEALKILKKQHTNRPSVAVIPDATIQYYDR
jgi:nickel-dependent lactate racemase